jgi:hypothetical protein
MTDPNEIAATSIALASIAGAAAGFALGNVRARVRGVFPKAVLVAAILVVAFFAPLLQDTLMMRLNTTGGPARVYIDLGAILVVPALATLMGAFIGGVVGVRRNAA